MPNREFLMINFRNKITIKRVLEGITYNEINNLPSMVSLAPPGYKLSQDYKDMVTASGVVET